VVGNNPEIMLTHQATLAELGISNNDFYLRTWMRFGTATSMHEGHVDFVEASAASTGQYPMFGDSGEELRLGASLGLVDLNIQPGTSGCMGEKTQRTNGLVDMAGGEGFNFDTERWYCVEMHFAGDPNDARMDSFELWVDESPIESLRVEGYGGLCQEDWMPDFAYVKFGAQNFSGQAGEVHGIP
jgi:hypothetical protein